MIEWTIRAGDILTLLGFGGTGILLAFKLGGFTKSIEAMQIEIVELKEVAKAVGSVLTTVAVQKAELEHLRSDVDDLKHGRGLVR